MDEANDSLNSALLDDLLAIRHVDIPLSRAPEISVCYNNQGKLVPVVAVPSDSKFCTKYVMPEERQRAKPQPKPKTAQATSRAAVGDQDNTVAEYFSYRMEGNTKIKTYTKLIYPTLKQTSN
uniref:Uncharacterized protein n=1 Tax=Pseudodiaptomus poplesia TaxID=213370 RepID=A0A0U2T665_9MAXI|nr:hypothetical protein [Pseudodiaptomus poplesia]